MYNYLSPVANSLCLVAKVGRAKSANLYAQLCACPIWILCVLSIIIIIQFLSYYMMQNHEYMLASGIVFHGLISLFLLDETLFCITKFASLIAWNLNWNEFKSLQVGSVTLLLKFVSAENLVQDLLKSCKIFLCPFKQVISNAFAVAH